MQDAAAELLNNPHIWIALFSCVSAQVLKGLIEYSYTRKLNKSILFGTGGMPSSHSAFVVAMAVSVGTVEGLDSPVFAVAMVFAIIVMYDAAGVRRAAGRHAKVINLLVGRLQSIGVKPVGKLKELLGHSPVEVVGGALWGIFIAWIGHRII